MPGRGLLLAAFLLGGCPSAETGLLVDLRSDFVPGVEVARARTSVTLEGRVVGMDDVSVLGADLLRGERIAEVSPLSAGSYLIVVELITPTGTILYTRRVRVDHRVSTAITVVATRDCEGRTCPGASDPADATECFGGRCVPSGCAMLGGTDCPAVLCAGDGDCPPPVAACAVSRCRDGVCLAEGMMGACGRDAVCVPDRGCVDLGPAPDGGADGGADAGHDAAPPGCTGGCDDGNPCTDDSCVSGSCRNTPNGAGCNDGNDCTHSDHCSGGACSGTGYGCAPMDCMTASCDGSGGCSYSGGCGGGSTCSGGSCVPCGGADQICCGGGGCNPGLWCYTGVCTCGQRGGPCCPWDMGCDSGTVCGAGTRCCVPYGSSCAAGGPCCDGVPCRSGICFD